MPPKRADGAPPGLREGANCEVTGGTHAGKSGKVADITIGAKHGQASVTVIQANGERFKTLAKNIRMVSSR